MEPCDYGDEDVLLSQAGARRLTGGGSRGCILRKNANRSRRENREEREGMHLEFLLVRVSGVWSCRRDVKGGKRLLQGDGDYKSTELHQMGKEVKPVEGLVYSVDTGKCSGPSRKYPKAAIGSMQ
jgi:hypothetical protein